MADLTALEEGLAALKNIDRPPLTFIFKDDAHAPIKMTYGLEMDLRRLLPDPLTAMTLLQNDVYTSDYVVRRCLTDTKKIVTDKDELISEEEIDNIDVDERERLLFWAGEHALYFFAKRTAGIGEMGSKFQALLPAQPKPSSPGSET